MTNFTTMKKTAMVILTIVLFNTTASAQKRVYDVVPGAGPKKKTESKTVYDVTKNKPFEKNTRVYYPAGRRKNLPPGQAKKIYGGSAKDYAPGQVKKRKGWYWNEGKKKWYHKRKHKKHHKHEDRD